METILNNIRKYVIFAGITFFPVFVLSGFASPYYVPKEIFLGIVVSTVLILTFIKNITKGGIKFSTGKFDIPVLLITVAYIAGTIFKTPNKMEAFFFPGVTTFVVLAAIIYFTINQLDKHGKEFAMAAVFASGILASLAVLFTRLGLFSQIPQLPAFIKDINFYPLGAKTQTLVYIAAVLPLGIVRILKEKDVVKKVFFGVASAVLIFAAIVLTVDIVHGNAQSSLPTTKISWDVAVETIKQSPLLGAGPANYLSAFNLYRPLSYNQTALWQTKFTSANNYFLTVVTELGFVGIATFVLLIVSIYKKIARAVKNKSWEELSIGILIVSFALVPIVPALTLLLMTLLAVYSESESKSVNVAVGRIPTIVVAIPVFAGVAALIFFGTKAVSAEMVYKKSLDALVANNAAGTYNYMVKAAATNPYVDRYHASLAQIDMALASSLATKENLSDSDRATITQLVQEAISEGKSTVTLNLGRSGNWEILAQVYRNIMGFAEGADQFAIQTYTQAIVLDQFNPNLRISLGGVYYALGDYDNAITAFQMAVAAKSDLANAHYNLASAYAAKKEYDKAITEMKNVLTLVTKDSTDYKTAQSALEQLEKQKPTNNTTKETPETLTTPIKTEAANINPPIDLPNEALPPAASN